MCPSKQAYHLSTGARFVYLRLIRGAGPESKHFESQFNYEDEKHWKVQNQAFRPISCSCANLYQLCSRQIVKWCLTDTVADPEIFRTVMLL